MNYDLLLSFVGATSLLALSPGPDNIYVLVQSLSNGKKYGMATVCGLISGCIVHTTLLAFGISAVIKSSSILFTIIKVMGALYLLFLAYKTYKSDPSIVFDKTETEKKGLSQLFVQGFFMNVLNPKVTIFFLAFFPGFLFSTSMSTVLQFYVLGGLFMITSFIIFSGIALFADYIKKYTLSNSNSGLFFKWLQVLVFIGIALIILL